MNAFELFPSFLASIISLKVILVVWLLCFIKSVTGNPTIGTPEEKAILNLYIIFQVHVKDW